MGDGTDDSSDGFDDSFAGTEFSTEFSETGQDFSGFADDGGGGIDFGSLVKGAAFFAPEIAGPIAALSALGDIAGAFSDSTGDGLDDNTGLTEGDFAAASEGDSNFSEGAAALISAFSGMAQGDAAKTAAGEQQAGISQGLAETRLARERGLGFLQPFQQVAAPGIEQAGFLTDPTQQFDFLQANPLFQASLDEAQTQTKNIAAARGRLSAGDTLQQLSKNVLLSAQPFIAEQKASIADLLNLGSGTAVQQANIVTGQAAPIADLLTSGGNVRAAGTIGAANAQSQALQGITNALLTSTLAGR